MIEIQAQLRQQQEDQTEALADLNDWMTAITKKEEAMKKKTKMAPDFPPVRGTVPVPDEKVTQPEKKEDPVQRFKDLGNDFFKKGKYKEAVDAYTKGIILDPKGFDTHLLYGNRALAYLNQNMWKEAEIDATVSVELNRTFTKGYFRRGTARVQLGNLRGALEDFERVVVLEPSNGEAQKKIQEIKAKLPATAPKAGATAAAPTRKKLVVQEVDDDDDDAPAPPPNPPPVKKHVDPVPATQEKAPEKAASPPASPPKPSVPLTQSQSDAKRKAEEALAQAERARAAQEEAKKAQAANLEKQQAARRRTNARVEEIEDEEEVVAPKPAPKKVAAPAARHMELPEITRDRLKAPKTYLEFEKLVNDMSIQPNKAELFAAYFQMIPQGGLKAFFKSNLSSDVLTEILLACAGPHFDAATTLNTLQELLKVSRAEDLLMFSEAKEKAALKAAFEKMKAASIDKGTIEKLQVTYKNIVPF